MGFPILVRWDLFIESAPRLGTNERCPKRATMWPLLLVVEKWLRYIENALNYGTGCNLTRFRRKTVYLIEGLYGAQIYHLRWIKQDVSLKSRELPLGGYKHNHEVPNLVNLVANGIMSPSLAMSPRRPCQMCSVKRLEPPMGTSMPFGWRPAMFMLAFHFVWLTVRCRSPLRKCDKTNTITVVIESCS